MTKKLLTLLLLLCVTSALHAANYLTFTAEADSSSFGIINKGSNNPNVQYSLDKGKRWMTLDTNTVVTLAKKGDMALLKGNNPSGFSHGRHIYTSFTMTGSIAASGSVMSLIDNKGDSKVIPCKWCFNRLFAECTSLVKAPRLSATQLDVECYLDMFWKCTNLTKAPELPATKLSIGCYWAMFASCTNLIQAPELPADSMKSGCYYAMFAGCTNLTQAPKLPATKLADACYRSMFSNCTSLTDVPDLYAKEMDWESCAEMFASCTSLTQAPALPNTRLGERSCFRMFANCTSLTEVPDLYAESMLGESCAEMFAGCTSLKEAPELPATEFSEYCYTRMFKDCINLCSIKVCFDSWYRYHQTMLDCFNPSSTDGWLSNVAPTGTFICPESLIELFEEDKIPIGWRMMHTEE